MPFKKKEGQRHQRVAEHRSDHQRQDDAQRGTPGAELEEEQQADRPEHQHQDLERGRVDGLVGRGHDPHVAGGEQEVDMLATIGFAEGLHLGDDVGDRRPFVVAREDQHLHRAAVGIEQAGTGIDRRHRLCEHGRVARQRPPGGVAFVPPRIDRLCHARQANHALHPMDAAHGGFEAVDGVHDFEVRACAIHALRLHDHGQHIHTDRERLDDCGRILVVA